MLFQHIYSISIIIYHSIIFFFLQKHSFTQIFTPENWIHYYKISFDDCLCPIGTECFCIVSVNCFVYTILYNWNVTNHGKWDNTFIVHRATFIHWCDVCVIRDLFWFIFFLNFNSNDFEKSYYRWLNTTEEKLW